MEITSNAERCGFCKGDCGSDTCVLAPWGYPYVDWLEILLFCSTNFTFVFCLWSYSFQNVLVTKISKLDQVAAAWTVLAVCFFFPVMLSSSTVPLLCVVNIHLMVCVQYQWVPWFLSLFVSGIQFLLDFTSLNTVINLLYPISAVLLPIFSNCYRYLRVRRKKMIVMFLRFLIQLW